MKRKVKFLLEDGTFMLVVICLLYTSDAADERSSVDLGGRRIIKKKKILELSFNHTHNYRHENHDNKKIK